MLLEGPLESISLVHHVLVFDADHAVVHVCGQLRLLGLLLVVKTRLTRTKRVLLVPLADLEA